LEFLTVANVGCLHLRRDGATGAYIIDILIFGERSMRGFGYLDFEDGEPGNGAEAARSNLPISEVQAKDVTRWLKRNFKAEIESEFAETPFSPEIGCAIACQESAYVWIGRLAHLDVNGVLGRSLGDASENRAVFPKDTVAFREHAGDRTADLLIEEANATRALRGISARPRIYYGYGIFQYDLQSYRDDQDFFTNKSWYNFHDCLGRLLKELKDKYARTNDVWRAVEAYNGSGPAATQYVENVKQFAVYCKDAWAEAVA
jgi:hypothetical protein